MTFLAASSLAESAAEEISLGEAVADGLMNMVVGLGVVFIVLIFLSFVISLFKYICLLYTSGAFGCAGS